MADVNEGDDLTLPVGESLELDDGLLDGCGDSGAGRTRATLEAVFPGSTVFTLVVDHDKLTAGRYGIALSAVE